MWWCALHICSKLRLKSGSRVRNKAKISIISKEILWTLSTQKVRKFKEDITCLYPGRHWKLKDKCLLNKLMSKYLKN